MATKTRLTLEEFLALPEEKPYHEFVDGEAVEKSMPNNDHGDLCAMLSHLWLALSLKAGRPLSVGTETRHIYRPSTPDERVYLPDVSVTERPAGEPRNQVRERPDLAIEVLSPGDPTRRVAEKMQFYSQAGITAWLVDPIDRTITVFNPGEFAIVLQVGDRISASPILEGESFSVEEIFSVLPAD